MEPVQYPTYPVTFSVDYPNRELDRVTTFFRNSTAFAAGAGGLLFFGPLLMILFREKYPRWWFDWNLELQRFTSRVLIYLALMDDTYPSTDEHQSVHLEYRYPDARLELNRWL